MIEWSRIPWSLWAYVVITLLGMIIANVNGHPPLLAGLLFVGLMVLWAYLLLRGLRWAWIFTICIFILGVIAEVASSVTHWRSVLIGLLSLLLLLLPATRRYFSGPAKVAM